jgi:hypothetical protein
LIDFADFGEEREIAYGSLRTKGPTNQKVTGAGANPDMNEEDAHREHLVNRQLCVT